MGATDSIGSTGAMGAVGATDLIDATGATAFFFIMMWNCKRTVFINMQQF